MELPHDGLLSFNITIVASNSCAILSVSNAPFINCSVTSIPLFVITFACPSNTSSPSPPTISAGSLGIERPPRTSGQIGIAFFSSNHFLIFSFKLCEPLYLTSKPAKQALTKIIAFTSYYSTCIDQKETTCIETRLTILPHLNGQ